MAKAKPIIGLEPYQPVSYNLPLIFSVRIAELWSFSRHLPHPDRVRELHDMRIAAKRLRYCFEFFAPSFGERLKKPLDRFKQLQDFLGEIHDCDVWMDRLRGEVGRAFRSLDKRRKGMLGHLGADAPLGKKAAALETDMSAAVGLLQMITEVVERRQKLYGELLTFWGELDQRDFRGELLRAVASVGIGTSADLADKKTTNLVTAAPPRRKTPAGGKLPPPQEVNVSDDMSATSTGIRAALDVGTNSVKLLVLSMHSSGSYEVLADENRVTGLGRGLTPGGELDPRAVETTLTELRAMVARARELDAVSIAAAGTSALRDAVNPQAILDPLREMGVDARVISGAEEADLARKVALRELPAAARDIVLFDTGGGSTELSWVHSGELRVSRSLELGARRHTELAGISHPVTDAMRRRLDKLIREELASAPEMPHGTVPQLAGLGGTATIIVWMLQGERGQPKGDPNGAIVRLSELRRIRSSLARQGMDEVKARPNMDPLRAEIVYAGATVIVRLLEHYGASSFTLVDRGLRWGLLLA